jgi:hypothetical protein
VLCLECGGEEAAGAERENTSCVHCSAQLYLSIPVKDTEQEEEELFAVSLEC